MWSVIQWPQGIATVEWVDPLDDNSDLDVTACASVEVALGVANSINREAVTRLAVNEVREIVAHIGAA